jgi:SAM-dependent methyltransferase
MDELTRIRETFRARDAARRRFFEFSGLDHVQRLHERYEMTLRMLHEAGFHPLSELRILDVGCGEGRMLRQFVDWGALPENVAGIDLSLERVAKAQRLSPELEIREGTATALPWPDASFDLVCQHTMFTSILDADLRRQAASEMARVTHPGGAVLWYDFMFDNPSNPDVRAMHAREIRELFPDFVCRLRRITLVPPISRRLPRSLLPIAYPLLACLPPIRSHLLGLLLKPGTVGARVAASDQLPMLASTSRT